MTILHVWSSREWRGGENQFRILLDHLPPQWRGIVAAPSGSQIEARLGNLAEFKPIRSAGYFDLKSVMRLRRLISEAGVSLIHAHTSPAHACALLARLGTDVPIVVSRRNAFKASGGWKFSSVDDFITISDAGRQQLVKAGVAPSRISVIMDSVEAPDDAAPSQEPVVICAAAFTAEKDHETLLLAWKQVEARMPEAQLRLIGEGALAENIAQRVKSLELNNVHFDGVVPDLAEAFRAARIVTLTSREEGLGSSLCLAQAMGIPVVATNAGGIPEAIADGQTGFLAPVGDADKLAEHFINLLGDDALHARMSEAALPRARALFDPAANAAAHVAIYEALLTNASSRG